MIPDFRSSGVSTHAISRALLLLILLFLVIVLMSDLTIRPSFNLIVLSTRDAGHWYQQSYSTSLVSRHGLTPYNVYTTTACGRYSIWHCFSHYRQDDQKSLRPFDLTSFRWPVFHTCVSSMSCYNHVRFRDLVWLLTCNSDIFSHSD